MGISGTWVGDKHGQATKQGKWHDALRPSPGLTCLTYQCLIRFREKKNVKIAIPFDDGFCCSKPFRMMGNNGDGLTNDNIYIGIVTGESHPILGWRCLPNNTTDSATKDVDLARICLRVEDLWVIPVIPSVIISSALFMIFMGAQNESLSNTFHSWRYLRGARCPQW